MKAFVLLLSLVLVSNTLVSETLYRYIKTEQLFRSSRSAKSGAEWVKVLKKHRLKHTDYRKQYDNQDCFLFVPVTGRFAMIVPYDSIQTQFEIFNPPSISLEEFKSLYDGCSYQDAVRIIGSRGELVSETSFGENHTEMYQWEGSGSAGANANAMFQNGKLVGKSQYGLK
jgi:hypothetical protein